MVSREVIEILRRFSGALEKDGITPHRLVLYGSAARGEATVESDIDIGVISELFGHDRLEEGVRLRVLAHAVDLRLEPIPLSEDAWEKDLWVPLIWEIRRTGIPLEDLLRAA
jgi:predicted nucleotidyltransferase